MKSPSERARLWFSARRKRVFERLEILALFPRVSAPLTVMLLLSTLMRGVVPIAYTLTSARVVASIPEAIGSGLSSDAGSRLLFALVLMGTIFVLQQSLAPLHGAGAAAFGRKVDLHLQSHTMRSLLSPPGIAHLEDPRLLDQVSVATGVGPGGWSAGSAVGPMTAITGAYLEAILAAVLLARFSWTLSVLLFVVLFVVRQILRLELKRTVKTMIGQARELRHSDYFRDLILHPAAAKETRIFGLTGWISERFAHHWREAMTEVWKERGKGAVGAIAGLLGHFATFGLMLFTIAKAGAAGVIGVEEVTIYALAVFNMRALVVLSDNELLVEYGLASAPAALSLDQVTGQAQLKRGKQDPSGKPKESVRFVDLEFRYPGSERTIYSGLNLDIPAGRSTAIVGANGSGKTTLIKLLCRLYDPTAGRITVDGTDIRDFVPEAWQRRVAAIFQDFVHYQLTAKDNVGFGAIERLDDLKAIERTAELVGVDRLVSKMPKGWETILSRQFTDGADLSGGEWQRVALARAIYAGSSSGGILVLDEPTANLDVRAEAEIYDRFLEITQGLTTILISHRFSTVRRADFICVLEDGRVIERGTHDELVALDGSYSRMFRLQASRFSTTDEDAEMGRAELDA